jgi:hypothetical protein
MSPGTGGLCFYRYEAVSKVFSTQRYIATEKHRVLIFGITLSV